MNIEEYLISLNFDISKNKGFEYWKEAISYCNNKNIFKMEDVYEHISKKYNSSRNAVEIAMRRCAANINHKIISKYIRKKYIVSNKDILISIIKIQKIAKPKELEKENKELYEIKYIASRFINRSMQQFSIGEFKYKVNNFIDLEDRIKTKIEDLKNEYNKLPNINKKYSRKAKKILYQIEILQLFLEEE